MYLTGMVRYCFSERWCEAGYTTAISPTEGKHSGGFEVSSLVQGFWMSLPGHQTISGFRPLKLPACQTCWKYNFLFASRKRATTATLPQRVEGLPSPGDIHRARPPLFRTISHNNVNSHINSPAYALSAALRRYLHTIVNWQRHDPRLPIAR